MTPDDARNLSLALMWELERMNQWRVTPVGVPLTLLCSFAMLWVVMQPARASTISTADIVYTTGNEVGSGNGTLDYVFFTSENGERDNAGGTFNGDNANSDMASGGTTSVSESYITSVGDLRDFYTINGLQNAASEVALSVDVNETGSGVQDIKLDTFEVWLNVSAFGDARDTPNTSDISRALQVSTGSGFSGGTLLASLENDQESLFLNRQGAGFADLAIFTGIDPFDSQFGASDSLFFFWESSGHNNGGEAVFLSGTYSPDDVRAATAVAPVPPAFWLFGSAVGLLGWLRRKAV